MSGISSKAAGKLENKFKYNGIELNEDLGVEDYDAHFRTLDPQTGRWWQIDPKIEYNQESESPYSSMSNDPILKSDPLGDLPCCEVVISGDPTARASKIFGGTQKAALVVEVLGGGPENPVADVIAGGIEVVGGLISLSVLTFDALTMMNNVPQVNAQSAPTNTSNTAGKRETGSYTNTHESGTKYHGKGDEKRAAESGKEKATKYKDPLKNTEYKKAENDREAFKDESRRLKNDGGHKSKNNYNKRDSPGTKYRKQDGEN